MKLSDYFRISAPHDNFESQWKTPLNFSVVFHIILLAAALILPSIIKRSPHLPEFYTVNLLNVTELAEQFNPARQPATATIAPEKNKTPLARKEASEKSVTSIVSPSDISGKAISLRPRKRKIKRADSPRDDIDIEKTKKALTREKRRAEQVLQKSQEQAASAAKTAVSKLREALRTSAAVVATESGNDSQATVTSPQAGAGIEVDEIMKGYYASVHHHIQMHWYLPPSQNWDDTLKAVMVIKVRKNGTIIKSYFEQKSNNIYFNQFLTKTMKEASPLPPFPEELAESYLEIGLRFNPSGVF